MKREGFNNKSINIIQVSRADNALKVKLPGQNDLSMSPTLIRHNNNPPEFLHHPNPCSCPPCSLPSLFPVILRLMLSQVCNNKIGQLHYYRSRNLKMGLFLVDDCCAETSLESRTDFQSCLTVILFCFLCAAINNYHSK